MSIQDATAALNEDTGLFAFLPVVNFVFLIIQQYSDALLGITTLAALASAVIYNVIAAETGEFSGIRLWVFRMLGMLWLLLLLGSMYLVMQYFTKSWIMPEILFFISVSFLCLLLTDIIFQWQLEDYEGQL